MAGSYYSEMAAQMLKQLTEKAEVVRKEVEQDVGKKADEHAFRVMIPVARAEVMERYRESANKWYAAFSPKRYSRTYGLMDVLKLTDPGPGSEGLGWMTEGQIMKKSWNGGTYDIYTYVFDKGSHGGPVNGHPPTYTEPIPKLFGLFDESSDQYQEVYQYLQEMIEETGQEYFEENFPIEFEKRFSF